MFRVLCPAVYSSKDRNFEEEKHHHQNTGHDPGENRHIKVLYHVRLFQRNINQCESNKSIGDKGEDEPLVVGIESLDSVLDDKVDMKQE